MAKIHLSQKLKKREHTGSFTRDNRGASVVVVLIVIALVSMLASTVMYMSYANYVMKVNDTGSKNNFYSAETVLDQINNGLQEKVSLAVGVAYEVASQTTVGTDAAIREDNFKQSYINSLRNSLKKGSIATKYEVGSITTLANATGLYCFLDNTMKTYALNYDEASDSPIDPGKGYLSISSENAVLEETTEGLVLREIKISFCDDDGYYSEIHTDIKLVYPDIAMATQNSFPEVDTYAIIAASGFENVNGFNHVCGNLYAGNKEQTVLNPDGKYGIDVGNGELYIESTGPQQAYSIVKGGVDLYSGKLTLTNCNLWTDQITVEKSKLFVEGDQSVIYNSDDLTVRGGNNEVVLKGAYVGYGDGNYLFTPPEPAGVEQSEYSSAIIINGKNSVINLKDMTSLYLAGSAFLNPYRLDKEGPGGSISEVFQLSYAADASNTVNGNRIVMGNSLAIKVDQLAYLVPRACIGVLNGETLINQNPMTQSEYDMWKAYSTAYLHRSEYKAVDYDKIYDVYGFTINAVNGYGYQVVAKQENGRTMYYVYLAFQDEADASNYYQSYITAVNDKMDVFAEKYSNKITLPVEHSAIKSVGNLVSCQISEDSAAFSLSHATINADTYYEIMNLKYAKTYENWVSLLTANTTATIPPDTYSKGAFDNMIDESAFSGFGGKNYFEENGVKALITNDDTITIDSSIDSETALVLTTGNVVVSRTFHGLILAGGHVSVNMTGNIVANEEKVQKALMIQVDADNNVASKFFQNGEAYAASLNSATSSVSYTNVKDLIVLENWSKH